MGFHRTAAPPNVPFCWAFGALAFKTAFSGVRCSALGFFSFIFYFKSFKMALVKYCDLPSRKSGKSLAQIKKGDSIEVNLLEIDDLFEFQIRLNELVERLGIEKIEIEYIKHNQFTRFFHIIRF